MPASPFFPKLPGDWSEQTEVLRPEGRPGTFIRLWTSAEAFKKETPKVLMIVHGFGEHSGRYSHFPFYLRDSLDAIGLLDLYGHGQSEGARGSCRSAEDWLGGIELTLKWLESSFRKQGRSPQIKVLGHSFGGLLSLEMARQKRWHGVKELFLSAPLLGLVTLPPAWKTKLGALIEPLLPQLPLKNEIPPEVVSHDPDVIRNYVQDPLNHDKVTPRAYTQMTELMAQNLSKHQALGLPLTLILPGADPLVDERLTARWFGQLEIDPSSPKRLELFPGLRHEAFNEIEKGRVFTAFARALG